MPGRKTIAELESDDKKQAVKRATAPGAYNTPSGRKVSGRKTIEDLERDDKNLAAKRATMSGEIDNTSGRKIEEETTDVRSGQELEEKKKKSKTPSARLYIPPAPPTNASAGHHPDVGARASYGPGTDKKKKSKMPSSQPYMSPAPPFSSHPDAVAARLGSVHESGKTRVVGKATALSRDANIVPEVGEAISISEPHVELENVCEATPAPHTEVGEDVQAQAQSGGAELSRVAVYQEEGDISGNEPSFEAFVPFEGNLLVSEEGNDGDDNERIRRYLIENAPLVEGTAVVTVDKAKGDGQKRWGWKQKAALVSAISISVCVVIGVVFAINPFSRGDDEKDPTETPSPQSPPSAQFLDLRATLLDKGVTSADTLDDPSTPQYRALTWLADVDGRQVNASGVAREAVQRYRLATLFYSTGGGEGSWSNDYGWLSDKHECNWNSGDNEQQGSGVYCDTADNRGNMMGKGGIESGTEDNTGGGIGDTENDTEVGIGDGTEDNSGGGMGDIVSGQGIVDKIHLKMNNLTGRLPEELWTMSSLQNMTFMVNQLTGSIPDSIRELSNLRFFCGGFNKLTGTVPNAVGQLSELIWLGLDANKLTGTIPSTILQLSMLKNLSMAYNELTGTLPSISNHSNPMLRWIYFGSNFLTGTLPSELPPLTIVDLPNNKLNGTIPETIGNLRKLKWLHLGRNELSGSIPGNIFKLTSLSNRLRLNNNRLEGMIPHNVSNLWNLPFLDLSSNQLTGTIPSGVGELERLELLFLNDNNLNGTVPSALDDLPLLREYF